MKTLIALFLSCVVITAFAVESVSTTTPNTTALASKSAQVLLHTSAGDITLELDEKAAPKSVANFLQYINEDFYNNTLFHRVIPDFMIQGGGFQPGMLEKPTHAPVANESSNGLKNKTGTVAMARTQNPDSATAQFFINLVDNDYLDAADGKPGYTVFGKVIHGMDVVKKIAQVSTLQRGPYADVPADDVIIITAKVLP